MLLAKLQSYQTKSSSPKKQAAVNAGYVDFSKPIDDQSQKDDLAEDDPRKQVMKFPTPCSNCDQMGNIQMCFSSIPFFKEIIMMAFVCDECGYRNSEIKEGGGIGEKAKKITLAVKGPKDLNRDCGRPVLSTLRDNETRLDPNENGQKIELWRVVETVFCDFRADPDSRNFSRFLHPY